MANKKISYTTRDFQSIRTELINFTRTYYPELIDNFNDASVFSALLDLNAAVSITYNSTLTEVFRKLFYNMPNKGHQSLTLQELTD